MDGTALIAAVKYVCVEGRERRRGRGVCVWVGVVVIAWMRECVRWTALIAAVKYVCVWGGEREEKRRGSVCGCDCVSVGMIVWVGEGVIFVGEERSVWVGQGQP